VGKVYAAMVSCGRAGPARRSPRPWLRMTRPARRLPYLQLDRVDTDQYQVGGRFPDVADRTSWTRPGENYTKSLHKTRQTVEIDLVTLGSGPNGVHDSFELRPTGERRRDG
jgi:hypothetical protein